MRKEFVVLLASFVFAFSLAGLSVAQTATLTVDKTEGKLTDEYTFTLDSSVPVGYKFILQFKKKSEPDDNYKSYVDKTFEVFPTRKFSITPIDVIKEVAENPDDNRYNFRVLYGKDVTDKPTDEVEIWLHTKCDRRTPTFSFADRSAIEKIVRLTEPATSATTSVNYKVTLKNNDDAKCGSSVFNIAPPSSPPGASTEDLKVTPSPVTIPAGQSAEITVSGSVKTTKIGTFKLGLTANRKTTDRFGAQGASIDLLLVVTQEQRCISGEPTINIAAETPAENPKTFEGVPGKIAKYTVTVTNGDKGGCSDSTIFLSLENLPSTWTSSLKPTQLILSPQKSGTATLTIKSNPNEVLPAIKAITVRAKNSRNSLTGKTDVVYRVLDVTKTNDNENPTATIKSIPTNPLPNQKFTISVSASDDRRLKAVKIFERLGTQTDLKKEQRIVDPEGTTVQVELTAGSSGEKRTFFAEVEDDAANAPNKNTNNIVKTEDLVIKFENRADLEVREIRLKQPVVGKPISIRYTVRNSGSVEASNIKVRLRIRGPEVQTFSGTIPSLRAGGEVTIRADYTFNTAGEYELTATVDELNEIDEVSEDNNKLLGKITVSQSTETATPGTGEADLDKLPDFIIRNITLQKPTVGKTVRIVFNISNEGKVVSENIKVRLRIGGPENAAFFGTIPKLSPGKYVEASVIYTFNQEGTYTISASVNHDDAVAESNKENNAVSGNVGVTRT